MTPVQPPPLPNNSPAPLIFPTIDTVTFTLFTQLSASSPWIHQQFFIEQRFISGWDRAIIEKKFQHTIKPNTNGIVKPVREYYGGGIYFLSDKLEYMDPFAQTNVEIPYLNPVPEFAKWGRFYSNTKNALYFDLDSQFTNGTIYNGLEEKQNTYRVQRGFQISRHYPQDDRQFVESTTEHMIRRPYCQALQVTSIVRKKGKV